MKIRKILFSVIFFAVCSFVFSGCQLKKNSPEKQIVKCSLLKEPESLDPQVASDYSTRLVVENLFEGLLKLGENGEVLPGVAFSFESNKNFTEFTFKLRKDVFWSNKEKTPVLAKDFVFAIKRALKKETNAPCAHILYCIKNAKKYKEGAIKEEKLGIKAIDDYTLKFTLENPTENFPRILTEPVTMPCNEDFFNSCSGQYGMESSKILSNGPFKIKNSQDHFKVINLVKNENYTGENKVVFKGITYIVKKSNENEIDSIKNKNLDISLIQNDKVEEARSLGINLVGSGKKLYWGIIFNENSNISSNLNFRKGVLSSLNRDYILSPVKEKKELKILENILENKLLPNFEKVDISLGNVDFEKLYPEETSYFLDAFLKETRIKKFSGATITCLDEEVPKKVVCNMIENLNKNFNCHFNMVPLSRDELFFKIVGGEYEIAVVPFLCESEFALDVLRNLKEDVSFNKLVKINHEDFESILQSACTTDVRDCEKNILKARDYLIENAYFYPLYEEPIYLAVSKNISNLKIYKGTGTINFLSLGK